MERLICIVIGYIFGLTSPAICMERRIIWISASMAAESRFYERPACDGKESGRDRIFRGLFQGGVCNGSRPSAV